jgi:peptide/nickel transport system ATP-binding protein
MEPFIEHGLGTTGAEATRQGRRSARACRPQPDMMRRFPHEFSGGQRQRASRSPARTDARSEGDHRRRGGVGARRVGQGAGVSTCFSTCSSGFNLAYLFISHDMAVVERVSHRVAVMYLGEIVEIGPRGPSSAIRSTPIPAACWPPSPSPIRAAAICAPPRPPTRSPAPCAPPDYVPPPRDYVEVSPGHLVQAWDGIWAESA